YDFIHFGTRNLPLTGSFTSNGVSSPFASTAPITQDAVHLIKIGANYRLGAAPVGPVYPPVKPARGTDWTGAYVGVQGGYGFGHTEWPTLASDYDVNGSLAGFDGGVNVQSGVFVFGVEGEWMWTGIRGSQTFSAPDRYFGGTTVSTMKSSLDW